MKHPLARLLRLRSLLEEVSRVELETCLQELAQIERALVHSQDTGRVMRRRSFSGIDHAATAERLESEALGAWVIREQEILRQACQSKTSEVEVAKKVYLERRKESRQVSSVIEARAAADVIESGRREQRELDDWFGQQTRTDRYGL